MKILIIDDEVNDIEKMGSLIEIIENQGHTVYTDDDINNAFFELSDPKNFWRYDLIIVDYQFNNSSKVVENLLYTGSDFCSKISELDKFYTPIIMLTGHNHSIHEGIKVLAEYGVCYFYNKSDFEHKIIENEISKIVALKSFKRVWTIRQYGIQEALKEYFINLPQNRIAQFANEAQKGISAIWDDNYKVIIKDSPYLINDLLQLPNEKFGVEIINKKVIDLIELGKKYPVLSDGCDSGFKKELNLYLESDITSKTEIQKQIDFESLDFLINILFIHDIIKPFEKTINHLNSRNKRTTATGNCTGSTSSKKFKQKLICRRVALGFQEIIDFDDNKINKTTLAALLRNGDTNILMKKGASKGQDTINVAPIFSTALGLFTPETRKSNEHFLLNDDFGKNYILDEERDWIKTHAKYALNFKSFLSDVSEELSTKFEDLSDFKNFIRNLSIDKNLDYETKVNEYLSHPKIVQKPILQSILKVFLSY